MRGEMVRLLAASPFSSERWDNHKVVNMSSSEITVVAIRELYVAFGRYTRPESIKCCPCGCTKPDATAYLIAVPLGDLKFADMLDFCFGAMTTQGSVDDFRYLLPRLMQGVVQEPCGCNPEILFGKLSVAKWLTWPPEEVDAVRRYLKALWLTALNAFPMQERLPAFFEIETVLASIAVTGDCLDWFLSKWTSTETEEANRNLIQFVTMYGIDFTEGRTFAEAFWKESQPQAAALRNWLLRPDTLQRITLAAHLLPCDGFEHLFRPGVEGLFKEAGLACPISIRAISDSGET